MDTHPLANQSTFSARALLVGERLELRILEETESLAVTPLTMAVAGSGVAVLFRYGAVVFFGVAQADQDAFLQRLTPLIGGAYTAPPEESMNVRVVANGREELKGNSITIPAITTEHLQVVADILAKSAVLTLYESRIARDFDRIEPLAKELKHTGRIERRAKVLVRQIGSMLLSEHMMVGRVSMVEKPEVLWENPSLEGLFIRLEDEFEIKERHDALERKLNLISRTAETLLDLLHNRHSLRVEWYVVILIIVEIVISLYELFFR